MKKTLLFSILLNVGLASSLLLLRAQRQQAAAAPALAAPPTAVQPSAISTPVASLPAHADPVPFRWNQLFAKDYHNYVKNLRSIGCPEATVRAIVAEDVQAAYMMRGKTLELELSDLEHASWTNLFTAKKSEAALKAELLAMPAQEAEEIADFLGLQPSPLQLAANNEPPRRPLRTKPIEPPLVFENFDMSPLNLSGDQHQAIARIRQDFLDQVGGLSHDPSDPGYQARWLQAQPAADNSLHSILGENDYMKYQTLAYQAALQNQATAQTP